MGIFYGIANATLGVMVICFLLVIVFVKTFYSLCKNILREDNRVNAHR